MDPLLSAFQPLRSGKLVSVTTSSSILLPSIPHLYKLAQYPIVIHVALSPYRYPEYSEITAVRQCGFIFLQSETLREGQEIALSAHALAIKSGKGVIHFFDPANSEKDDPVSAEEPELVKSVLDVKAARDYQSTSAGTSSLYVDEGRQPTIIENEISSTESGQPPPIVSREATVASQAKDKNGDESSVGSSVRESSADSRPTISSTSSINSTMIRPVTSEDILGFLSGIWSQISTATGRTYQAFEYSGPDDADSALFVFGSTGVFVDEILEAKSSHEFAKCGIITARLYRPWIGANLIESIPQSVKRIAVLEQIRKKTVKWGPVLMDILTSLRTGPSTSGAPMIVGHQLGYIEPSTARQALRGIFQNLKSPSPIQNLEVGNRLQPRDLLSEYSLEQPKIENAYMKILDQVFGERLHIANQLGATDAGISASIAANPEFGFGSLLARMDHRKRFIGEVQEAAATRDFVTDIPRSWLSKWALSAEDPKKANGLAQETIARLSTDGSKLAGQLLVSKSLFFKESQWLIGSDAWAYDLGNSGVHHVIASGANVNMLIIDSQPWSERAAADATRRKKDIGLYAMNFGNAYVASVAVYSSYTQVLEAMIEADQFDGPSVVVAYLPYNKESDSPLTVLQETKKAVDLGYWPLYRWNPSNEEKGEANFSSTQSVSSKSWKSF